MKYITDDMLLESYIEKYKLLELFDNEIIKDVKLHLYEKHEYILHSNSELEYYYLLVDGRIKVSYPFENGKPMYLKFYKPFITVGDLELMKNTPVLCDVEAVVQTYMIVIPVSILRSKYLKHVGFLQHLVDSLSDKLFATINNSSYNYIYPLENRLSSYLIEQFTDKNYIRLDESYQTIAEFLGTTYRHLSRTLKELEEKKIISCDHKKVYILDENRLQELSKNTYVKS